jgi:glutathione S-transferase
MKLYYSPGACSLAAHIVAREADLPLDIAKVDLKQHKLADGGDYYAINPKGYVPALEVDGGAMLTENVAILNYLADHAGDSLFTPAPATMERYRLEEWLGFITTELHKSFAPLFQGGGDDEKRKAKEKIVKRFGYVEERLAGQDYLMGSQLIVADDYLFVMLAWAMKMELDLGRFPNLTAFFARMAKRDGVRRALNDEGLPLPT